MSLPELAQFWNLPVIAGRSPPDFGSIRGPAETARPFMFPPDWRVNAVDGASDAHGKQSQVGYALGWGSVPIRLFR